MTKVSEELRLGEAVEVRSHGSTHELPSVEEASASNMTCLWEEHGRTISMVVFMVEVKYTIIMYMDAMGYIRQAL